MTSSSLMCTTLGVVRVPSALPIIAGLPPSITATAEKVVPKSIPMVTPETRCSLLSFAIVYSSVNIIFFIVFLEYLSQLFFCLNFFYFLTLSHHLLFFQHYFFLH